MKELLDRAVQYKSIAVVGLAKNTGKTVTVNCLLDGLSNRGLTVGLTSTGRDGEKADVLTDLPKPPVVLPRGAVVATAGGCLGQGTARLEILASLDISNPLGEIVLARVREPGTAEISGPERTRDVQAAIDALRDWSDLVLIDGALDRIAASAPAVTEAAILATGAVLSYDLERVVESTVFSARKLLLPASVRLTPQGAGLLAAGRSGVQSRDGTVKPLPMATLIDGPVELLDYLDAQWSCLLVGGALTNELARLLAAAAQRIPGLEVVVRDGTRIFADIRQWQELERNGVSVTAAAPINLLGVSVNPVGKHGRRIPGAALVEAIAKMLPGVLVVDPLA